MKKPFLSALTIVSMLLTPYLRAQDPAPTIAPKQESDSSSTSPTTTPEPEMQSTDAPASDSQPNTPEAAAPDSVPNQEPAALSPLATEPESEDEGTPVGQASTEGSKAAKKKMWSNIALAVVTVAIAVTALILVSQNHGHSKHHDHKK